MRNGGGLNQSGSRQGSGKWSDCGCIFKEEPTRFAHELVIEDKRGKKRYGRLQVFGLSNWKEKVATH